MPYHLLFGWVISYHLLLRDPGLSEVKSCGCCREQRLAISHLQCLVCFHRPRILLLDGGCPFAGERSAVSRCTMQTVWVQFQAIGGALSGQGGSAALDFEMLRLLGLALGQIQ